MDTMIRIDNVSKQYRLGQIGGGTLQGDLQSWWAKKRGKEDPNSKIGAKVYAKNEKFMALDGVSFEVKRGERVGIIGHNGAGKSTLLKLLSRVTAPTKGEIGLNGRVASMLEVGTGFHGELTGRENIYMNGAILGMTKKEIDAKMEDIIEFSECRQFIDTPVKRYSSGMYVKLAFSVAAHLDSEIMIMDEVLAVGDTRFQHKCLTKMREVAENEGRTILYVSHNMNTIRRLCNKCIVLEHGKKIFEGDVEEAIALYVGSVASTEAYTVFKEKSHKYLSIHNDFLMKSLTIENPSTQYLQNQNIFLTISCISKKNFDKVNFRLEIKNTEGNIIGTTFSNGGVDFETGKEKRVSIKFSTNHLTSGKYIADLIAFTYTSEGGQVFIDGVYPGLIFDIGNELQETNELQWRTSDWGYIRLEDLEIQR